MLYTGAGEQIKMNRKAPSLLAIATLILLAVPVVHAQQPQTSDLTKLFRDGGITNIERLQVVEIGGIVVIRGRTLDAERAAEAGRFAQSLGYTRVANLVQLAEPADDAKIQRTAERQLAIHRALDGSNVQIASRDGIVRLSGRVSGELQRDLAVQLIRNIDGVRAVYADGLQR
jgi:osmotically-inducible protein OsmY